MNTQHTYNITKFGEQKQTEMKVEVTWPKLTDLMKALGEERVEKILYGFVAAHHVQSKIKGAFGAEKKSDEQLALIGAVRSGLPLNGIDFFPEERAAGEDAFVKKLRAAHGEGKLDDAKMIELQKRFGDKGEAVMPFEGLVGLYKEWKKAMSALDL